ncbi:MAG: hypothetical protein K0R63_1031 [Rickettsiales bacterium]|jgi:hypothetical protein|nr:hypothetical protein [Rickettsiales bacterium]
MSKETKKTTENNKKVLFFWVGGKLRRRYLLNIARACYIAEKEEKGWGGDLWVDKESNYACQIGGEDKQGLANIQDPFNINDFKLKHSKEVGEGDEKGNYIYKTVKIKPRVIINGEEFDSKSAMELISKLNVALKNVKLRNIKELDEIRETLGKDKSRQLGKIIRTEMVGRKNLASAVDILRQLALKKESEKGNKALYLDTDTWLDITSVSFEKIAEHATYDYFLTAKVQMMAKNQYGNWHDIEPIIGGPNNCILFSSSDRGSKIINRICDEISHSYNLYERYNHGEIWWDNIHGTDGDTAKVKEINVEKTTSYRKLQSITDDSKRLADFSRFLRNENKNRKLIDRKRAPFYTHPEDEEHYNKENPSLHEDRRSLTIYVGPGACERGVKQFIKENPRMFRHDQNGYAFYFDPGDTIDSQCDSTWLNQTGRKQPEKSYDDSELDKVGGYSRKGYTSKLKAEKSTTSKGREV